MDLKAINKKIILQIAVLLVVVLFLLQPLGMGGVLPNLFPSSDNGDSGVETTGLATFNATIRTYEPILVLPVETEQSVVDELNTRADVKSVIKEAQGIVVETETRDDVYPLAVYLKGKGVSSLSRANVIMPTLLEVELQTGKKEVYSPTNVLGVVTEPVLDAGSEVTVSMVAVIRDDMIIDYYSAQILMEDTSIIVDAVVQGLNYRTYSYTIPWESRNSLGNLSEYGEYDYDRKDMVVFTDQLDVGQIMAKKLFPYITYIDAGSAQVRSDFDNTTLLATNFADVNYTLPDSSLVIMTNKTPDIPFNATVTYNYRILIVEESTDYVFEDLAFDAEMDEEQELDSTVSLNVSVVAADRNVVSVGTVSPS